MERELEEGKSDGTARGGTTFSQLFPSSRWRGTERERKDEMNKDEGKGESEWKRTRRTEEFQVSLHPSEIEGQEERGRAGGDSRGRLGVAVKLSASTFVN